VNVDDIGQVIYIHAGPAYPFNYTFSYNTRSVTDGFGYTLRLDFPILNRQTVLMYVSTVYTTADTPSPAWEPVPLLNRTDADVTLMMLNQNDVVYSAPSDDPWMPAHRQLDPGYWVGDYSLNLMACTDQYQICNSNRGNGPSACTKLSGHVPVMAELGLPGNAADLNYHQTWTAVRILTNAVTMSMYHAVSGRGASALNGQSNFSS
jgi:hypothetical protein